MIQKNVEKPGCILKLVSIPRIQRPLKMLKNKAIKYFDQLKDAHIMRSHG
jgi:hypothetical protein